MSFSNQNFRTLIVMNMLKSIVLIVLSAICFNTFSQKVKNEKFEINYKQYPLINLPGEIENFSSNDDYLKIYSKERVHGTASLQLSGKVFPMQTYNNVFGETLETVSMSDVQKKLVSQPVLVDVKDKEGKCLYYRVFNNIYQEAPDKISSEVSGGDKMSSFLDVSSQISLLFEDRIVKTNVKLFNVEKSDNHADMQKAYKVCIDGVNSYNEGKYDEGKALFNESIGLWEEALKEIDVDNKKARINKKIGDAIYKNLVQILPFVGRNDDASILIDEHYKVIGGFNVLFTQGKKYHVKKLGLNTKAQVNGGNYTLAELESNQDTQPLTSNGDKTNLYSAYHLKNLLVGSWRFFYESYKLPTDIDAEKLDRNPNSNNNENHLLHLLPGGKIKIQNGSWDAREKEQEFDEYINFWDVKHVDGKGYFLIIADEKDDLQDQGMCTIFKIMDLNKTRLAVGGLTYPDGDTTTESVIQYQKIDYLLDDGLN